MIPQQSNTSNVQFPLFSPQNPKPRKISKARINPDMHIKKRHNTRSNIQFSQSGPIDFLNKSNFPNTSRKINTNSKLLNLYNNENENFNVSSWTNFEFNKLFPTSFKPNLSNLCNKNSQIKTAVKSLLLPRKDRNIISIRIETNWENSDYISMNFISLYDKYSMNINPMNNENGKIHIASIPEPSSLNKLEYLLDTSYAKEDENIFNELFENKNFTIFLSIDKSIEVSSIRIFNSPIKKQSAVKDVSIYMNDKFYAKGQIPQNFGDNFNFDDHSIIHNQENQFLLPKITFYSDKYGILSIKPITELRFEIIETYNSTIFNTNNQNKSIDRSSLKKSTKNYVGVNGFDFIDILGNLILTNQDKNETENDINYIKEVKIRGICELINRGMLLKKNKKTTQENEMLLGIADNSQLPSFHFTFNKPTFLSKVLVWNYNGFGNHLNCGIKKIKLYADQKLMWIGKIPKGNGKFIENFHSIQLFDSINELTKISS